MNRRVFLVQTGAALSGAALAPLTGCVSPAETTGKGIVDTHTHFYDPTRKQGVPWPPREDGFLYRPVLPEEFKRLATPLGVSGTVVVEASEWERDNQWVLDLAKQDPVILGLVGHLKPGAPDFNRHLANYAKNRRFRGIRTGLWGIKIEPGNDAFVGDLRQLAERKLALDILVGPDQLPVVAELAAKAPDLIIIIDHCVNVRIDGKAPPKQWIDGVRAAARHQNVQMKVSGLVEGSGRSNGLAPKEAEYYRPVLDALWEAFGVERLLFGSNWPVSARFATYATVLQIAKDYFGALGGRAVDCCLRSNAQRIYGVH